MASKSNISAAKDSSPQSVRVFVRCRPMSHAETHQKCIPVVDILNQKEIAVQDRFNSKLSKTFAFDKIFGASSGQVEVYNTVVEPFIADVLAGFNCTVFAYGQTGTGKTHTMEGELYEDPNKLHDPDSRAGILPRTMCALFDELRMLQAEYTVRISYLELYNEEIYDLLSPDAVPPKLRMFDDSTKRGSVIIQGLQEVMVHTRAQVFAELRKGSAKKQVAATLINANSSRSHTVFCVTVHMKENSMHGEELLKTGKLYLVDLAGSESIGRSGSVEKRAREAGSINQSLLTLGRVISALIDRHPHIPYRESKLTRLLQDSLGGRAKTSIIATISPAYSNVEETLSTLDYAHRAKHVTNRPEINQKVSKKVIMKEYMDVIEGLKTKLDLHRKGSGIFIAEKNYEEMQNDLTKRDKELSETVAEMKAVSRKMESTEQTFQHLTSALKEKTESVKEAEKMLKLMRIKVTEAENILETTKEDNVEANELVKTVAEQEKELRKRASILLSVVDDYNRDSSRIHERLQLSRALIKSNEEVLSDLHQVFMKFGEAIHSSTSSLFSKLSFLGQVVEMWENEKCQTNEDVTYFKKSLSVLSLIGRDSMKRYSEVLNKKHSWKNDLNKKSFSEMKSAAERSINAIKSLSLVVTNACAELQKLASKVPKEVLKLVSLSTNKFAEYADICCRQKENLCSTFDDINTAVSKQRQNIEEFVDTLVLSIQQENNRQLDNFKKSQQSIYGVNTILLELNSSNSLHMSEAKINFSKIEEKLAATFDLAHDYNGTIEDNLKNAQSVSEASKANINDARTSVLNDLSDNLSKIIPMHESAVRIVDGMSVSAKMFIEHEANTFKNFEASAEASVMNRRDICSVQEGQRLFNEVQNVLPTSTDDLMKRKQNVIEKVELFIQQPCTILKSFDSEIASVGFAIKNIICDQRNLLDDTIESKVAYDRPSGCTPARKSAINLPKVVFLPSPYEKKVKSRVQNAVAKIKRVKLKFKKKRVTDVDECMASDSEVTYFSRDPKPTALAKSSSLVDLRTIHSFSRPRARAGKKFRQVAK